MTLKEAIVLSLEVWRYLAAHPEITDKHDLPKKLFGKIKNMEGKCPLCEYNFREGKEKCYTCPLFFEKEGKYINCDSTLHPYWEWAYARLDNEETRKEGATAIVKLLEAALEKENRNEESN
jgi:hypothetical protein